MADEEPEQTRPLRERKRLAAMRHIQDVAIEQFERRGFEQVTIEEVAAASDVSASSVYRYFGSKEGLVVWDPHDAGELQRALSAQGDLAVADAVRAVVVTTLGEVLNRDRDRIRRRIDLAVANPSVEAALALRGQEMAVGIASLVASQVGRPADDLEVQVFAHAVVGAIQGGLRHWHATGYALPVEELLERSLSVVDLRTPLPATGS